MEIRKRFFDIFAVLLILFSSIVGFMGVFFLSIFLTNLQLMHPFFIWLIILIGVYCVFYLHYKVTKYLELFEKKEKSVGDEEIDNLFEWNPKK